MAVGLGWVSRIGARVAPRRLFSVINRGDWVPGRARATALPAGARMPSWRY
jgi:hypothetical protein